MQMNKPIHAVIGVRRIGGTTFYVRRSEHMENYPGVWSLFSTQYDPALVGDVTDLEQVTRIFQDMSAERLGGVRTRAKSYLTSGSSDQNPMGVQVTLHLYEIEFDEEPRLNPRYYTDGAWLTPEQYEECCAEQVCGLCLRLLSDYAWIMGYTSRPFIPHTPHAAVAG